MAVWLLSACSSQKKGDGEDVQVLMKDSVDANGILLTVISKTHFTIRHLHTLQTVGIHTVFHQYLHIR